MRATVIAAFVFLLVAAPAGAERGRKAVEPLDASLREVVHRVPVAAAGAQIVVTSFRPRGDGPFPWLVLSHGTAPTLEANRKMRRYRPLAPVPRQFVKSASSENTAANACASCLFQASINRSSTALMAL